MAKRTNKSISDLLGKKKAKPSIDEVNKIAEQIHTPSAPKKAIKTKTKLERDISNRSKRISLNAPLDLYLEIQREATLQGKPMMLSLIHI